MQIQREEMSHLNRVALMGEMTASVAHELNQPLTAIANNASAARRFLERGNIDPDLLQQLLRDMVADSQRAGEVIRGIRAMVQKDKHVVRGVLNLNAVIADTIRLVSSDILLRESVVATEMDHSLPQVTDIWIPGITGLEILARTCALSPRPRVIVITARDDLAARATAMAVGPVAFFIKPFNDEQFLAAVHDALAQEPI